MYSRDKPYIRHPITEIKIYSSSQFYSYANSHVITVGKIGFDTRNKSKFEPKERDHTSLHPTTKIQYIDLALSKILQSSIGAKLAKYLGIGQLIYLIFYK